MAKSYLYIPPDGGVNYNWWADHKFVKSSSDDMGEQYAVMEDNLKSNFSLYLHFHRKMLKVFTS